MFPVDDRGQEPAPARTPGGGYEVAG